MKPALSRLLLALAVLLCLYALLSLLATFSQLADAADRVLAGAGQPVFWSLLVVFGVLLAWPVWLWLRLPRMPLPPPDRSEPAWSRHQQRLRAHWAAHPDAQVRERAAQGDLAGARALLDAEADRLIEQSAASLFVSTALIQNGRLDGLLLLAAQLRLVWQVAAVYRMRLTPRQLGYLYGHVAGAFVVSGQLEELDFVEMASPVVTAVVPSLAGAAPGLQGVGQLLVNSLANGAANAFLTLRVGAVAKAYCMPAIEPEPQAVRTSATQAALSQLARLTSTQGTRVVQAIWTGIRRQTGQAVTGALEATRDAAGAVADTVASTVGKTAQAVSSATQQTASAVVQGSKAVVSSVGSASARAGSVLADTARGAGDRVKDAGKAATQSAGRLFEGPRKGAGGRD